MYGIITWGNGTNVARSEIVNDVSRVGSLAAMDICIADLPSHAFTLEASSGRYTVLNRACTKMVVGGKKVPIGRRAEWRLGTEMSVNDTKLTLTDATIDRVEEKENPWNRPDPSESEHNERLSQLTVVAAVGIVILVWFCDPFQSASTSVQSAEYGKLQIRARSYIPNDDYRMKHGVFLLRQARQEELWDADAEAISRYENLKQYLRSVRSDKNYQPDADVVSIIAGMENFADSQISNLSR